MTLGDELYHGSHATQFDGGPLASQNCTPTSLSDAIRQMSRGAVDLTGSEVRAVVRRSEETDPNTPGWSMPDAALAARRLGFTVVPKAGPWGDLVAARRQGRGILLQGDSDVFTTGCEARFDGPHCIYLDPLDYLPGVWRKGDPLCPAWDRENEATLKRYAGKLAGSGRARYAYTTTIPLVAPGPIVEDDMAARSFKFDNTARAGMWEVQGDGHMYVRLADAKLYDIGDGIRKRAFGPVALVDQAGRPIGPGGSADKRTRGYIIESEAAFMIEADGVFTPDAGLDVKHKVALAIDGKIDPGTGTTV